MGVKQQRSTLFVSAAAAATCLFVLTVVKKSRAGKKKSRSENADRLKNRVAYLRIQTPDLIKSLQFYQALGFELVVDEESQQEATTQSKAASKFVVLKCPGRKLHQPYILLQHDPNFTAKPRHAAHVGYGRFCFAVADVHAEVERLKTTYGIEPLAPPVTDKPGTQPNNEAEVTIVAYEDPTNGVQAELVSMKSNLLMKIAIKASGVQFPLLVHVNINVSKYANSLQAYQQLGFSKTSKYYGKVVNNLYKALCIPDPGIANEVCLIKTPEENFFAIDLIEWDSEKNAKNEMIPSAIRLGLAVDDIALCTDDLLHTGKWKLHESPKVTTTLPRPFAKNTITSIVQDLDGVPVELVQVDAVKTILENPKNISAELITCLKNDVNDTLAGRSTSSRVVLITGCDSGFGRSLAIQTAALGFAVVAACYTRKGADYLKDTVASTVVADFATEDGPLRVVEACQKEIQKSSNGELHAIINNAGFCFPGNVEWTHPSIYKRSMAINVHAPIAIIYGLMRHLKETKGGSTCSRIIQVSSVCGILSSPTNTPYCATKHALESYSDGLRAEMAPFGVQVCIVQPSTMRTPLASSYWQTWKKGYLDAPLERQTSMKQDKLDEFVDGAIQSLDDSAEDPRVTIDAILNVLVEDTIPTRLLTGSNAYGFHILSWLPDKVRDNVLYGQLTKELHTSVMTKEKVS